MSTNVDFPIPDGKTINNNQICHFFNLIGKAVEDNLLTLYMTFKLCFLKQVFY